MVTVYLVRHGEVANPQGIVYGSLPRFALAPDGIVQAQRAAAYLAGQPIIAVFSSPLLRARQTAAPIAAKHGLRVRISRLLTETDEGPLEGLPLSQVTAAEWATYGEAPVSTVARITRFLDRCSQQFEGSELVAVTHGDNIGFLHLALRGQPLQHQDKLVPAFGSIFAVHWSAPGADARRGEWVYVAAP